MGDDIGKRAEPSSPRLVLDWDGTCTVRDSLVEAVRAFGDPSVLGRSLEEEIGSLRSSAAEASAWAVEHVRLRPGFHELVSRHAPLILSSGLEQLIRPVLEREGVELEVRCNVGVPSPDGWGLLRYDEQTCGTCAERCKRGALPAGEVVYVGDGVSDHCAALAARRIFARDGLAAYLDEQGVAYEPFEDLHDVAAALS